MEREYSWKMLFSVDAPPYNTHLFDFKHIREAGLYLTKVEWEKWLPQENKQYFDSVSRVLY